MALVTATALLWIAARARRVWDDPGGRLFSVAIVLGAAGYVTTAGFLLVQPRSSSMAEVLLVGSFQLLFPLVWGAFAGRQKGLQFVTTRRVGAAGLGLLAVLVVSNGIQRLLDGGLVGTTDATAALIELAVGLPASVAVLASVSLLLAGSGLLVHTAATYGHVDPWEAAVPTLAALATWFHTWPASVVVDAWSATAAMAAVAAFGGISAAGFWVALSRTALFDHPIAAGTIGHDRVVETMEDAVLVVDAEGHLLGLNPVARRLFEVRVDDVVGHAVGEVVGEPLATLRSSELVALETLVGVREFEPRASAVTGGDGGALGFSLVLRDVTERRTREERLAVLNRVLRHNVRNEVSVISGYAELLDDGGAVPRDRAATQIAETVHDLAELGEKARVLQRMMSDPPTAPREVALGPRVDEAVAGIARSALDCRYETSVPADLEVSANPTVLAPVVENLVENAGEHNDAPEPQVTVRASAETDTAAVRITTDDNGPGIPADERAVLESGDVTPLEHRSGLGLWIAKWCVTRLGGALSFEATEPRGTTVTVRLPGGRQESDGPVAAAVGPSTVEGP